MTTEQAYAEVERLTRRRARNFAYGIMVLPREKRRAIAAIYAFARRVDDVADGELPRDEKQVQLESLRTALDSPGPDAMSVALAGAAAEFNRFNARKLELADAGGSSAAEVGTIGMLGVFFAGHGTSAQVSALLLVGVAVLAGGADLGRVAAVEGDPCPRHRDRPGPGGGGGARLAATGRAGGATLQHEVGRVRREGKRLDVLPLVNLARREVAQLDAPRFGGLRRQAKMPHRERWSGNAGHDAENRDDDLIENAGAALDDVDVTVGQRVERPGIDGDARNDQDHGDHGELLRLLVRVERGGDRRVDARIEEIAEDEEDDEGRDALAWRAIVRGTRDYCAKNGSCAAPTPPESQPRSSTS